MIIAASPIRCLACVFCVVVLSLFAGAAHPAPFAYITNQGSNNVSVIDTATNTVVATVAVGTGPYGVAVNPAGTRAYVTNRLSNKYSVIDTFTKTVIATVAVGTNPIGVAVNPAGTRAYVANQRSQNTSVIDTATNTVIATVAPGTQPVQPPRGTPDPFGVAVNPAGTRAYVTVTEFGFNFFFGFVSTIDTATNTVISAPSVGSSTSGVAFSPDGTYAYVTQGGNSNVVVFGGVGGNITVGSGPLGVAFNPAGTRAYVANSFSNNVSVINTATRTVVASVLVGTGPIGVAVNPTGTRAYVANAGSDSVSVIDTATNAVIATVAVGSSPSAFGVFIGDPLPPTRPGAPAIGSAIGGNAQAAVSFTPPTIDGGTFITSYTVTSNPGGLTASGAASPITVAGLTNGMAYTFTVTATNAVGAGSASAASNSVTPAAATVPGAPTGATATRGNAQATVTFTAPASNGGSAITGYTVMSNPAGAVDTNAGTTSLSHVIAGLTNGTAYTFMVTATNAVGTSVASSPSNSVTPATVPGAPTGATATSGNAQATVTFIAPASNGGAAITGYTVTSNPAGGVDSNAGTTGLSHVITSLTNGTAYTFTVTATNAVGTGPASAGVTVTPRGSTYSSVSATGSGTITASFTGGGAACSFGVAQFIAVSGSPSSPPAGSAPPSVSFPHGLFDFTTTGCTPGSTITMTIIYPNVLPPGTQYYKYGPRPGPLPAAWYVLPATIVGNTITFTITDGQIGDDDLLANGTIVDPGGPGAGTGVAISVPTLSEWGMIVLAMLLAGIGMRQFAHRRS